MFIVNKHPVFKYVELFIRDRMSFAFPENSVVILGYQELAMAELEKYVSSGLLIFIYQFEQLTEGCSWLSEENLAKLRKATLVIDYDHRNIAVLERYGIRAVHNLLGYTDLIDVNCTPHKDIDVLFCGVITGRRSEILHHIAGKLASSGYNMSMYYGDLFANNILVRSKIFLNIHYYNASRQEQVRMHPALCNGNYIISEPSHRNYYGALVDEVPTDMIADRILSVLSDESWNRKDLIKSKYMMFTDATITYNNDRIKERITWLTNNSKIFADM